MSTVSHADRFEIFKFKKTGLVALCHEVSLFAQSPEAARWRVDLTTARFGTRDDIWQVFFDYEPPLSAHNIGTCRLCGRDHTSEDFL